MSCLVFFLQRKSSYSLTQRNLNVPSAGCYQAGQSISSHFPGSFEKRTRNAIQELRGYGSIKEASGSDSSLHLLLYERSNVFLIIGRGTSDLGF